MSSSESDPEKWTECPIWGKSTYYHNHAGQCRKTAGSSRPFRIPGWGSSLRPKICECELCGRSVSRFYLLQHQETELCVRRRGLAWKNNRPRRAPCEFCGTPVTERGTTRHQNGAVCRKRRDECARQSKGSVLENLEDGQQEWILAEEAPRKADAREEDASKEDALDMGEDCVTGEKVSLNA